MKTLRIIEFCIVILFGSFFSYFIFTNYGISLGVVTGCSMEPTYHDLDKILIHRFPLLWRDPIKDEIVLVWQPSDNRYDIKRVVAVPGDPVLTMGGLKEYKLGKDQYFIVGDNLDKSYDSRYYGPVHRVQIIGVVK